MATIIRGTTPTIIYTLKTVNVTNITQAYVTFKENNSILLKKTLAEAEIVNNALAWKLTQAETLKFKGDSVSVMLNWLTDDGTRGGSKETKITLGDNHIEAVI